MKNTKALGESRFQPASTPREDPTATATSDFTTAVNDEHQPERSPVEIATPGKRPAEPIIVRPARATDLAAVRSLKSVVRLNQPDVNLVPYSALRSAIASLLPGGQKRPRFFVASATGRIVGFSHFMSTAPDQRWQLISVGTESAGNLDTDATLIWEELVAKATVAAGQRGVKRLYARSPREWPVAESLRAVGFAPYATESVYLAREPRTVQAVTNLRAQEQTDTWAIHQLYNASVPRQVQYAEAFTSHRWDVRSRFDGHHGMNAAGWLIEDGHHVVGYARILDGGAVCILEVLYHPERVEVLELLIDGALSRIGSGRRRRQVYCGVRGYQSEAARLLEQRGFAPVLEQELHLKYTTANVRLPAAETVVLHTEVKEKLPKRVPSFLHGRPPDESAT